MKNFLFHGVWKELVKSTILSTNNLGDIGSFVFAKDTVDNRTHQNYVPSLLIYIYIRRFAKIYNSYLTKIIYMEDMKYKPATL